MALTQPLSLSLSSSFLPSSLPSRSLSPSLPSPSLSFPRPFPFPFPVLSLSTSSTSPSPSPSPPSLSLPLPPSPSSLEYNQKMQRLMANPYEYHHSLGMYLTRITPHLVVGSQPQSPADIQRLHVEENVSAVLSLQQDHDVTHWGVDPVAIRTKCTELGIRHYSRPARDFDPYSLRRELPRMVAVIDRYAREGRAVYVHCTAGLGRAPGAAIAYLFWFGEMDMISAYDFLTSKRPCGPKKEAIRGATYDLAKNSDWQPPLEHLPDFAFTDVADWERRLIQERVRSLYH